MTPLFVDEEQAIKKFARVERGLGLTRQGCSSSPLLSTDEQSTLTRSGLRGRRKKRPNAATVGQHALAG